MIKHGTAIAIFAVAAATAASAEELITWGEVSGWAILIDPSVGNGCLMERQFEDDTLVQFGTVPNRNGGFFAAYNPDWTDIEDGATGTIKFEFPKIRFTGEVVGVAKEGLYGGYAFFDNPNVTLEFGKNKNIIIIGELGRTINVSLTGTMKAIQAVKQCQSEQSE